MKKVSPFALCCLMIFAACDNNLKPVETETPVEKGYGKISVSFAGEETAPRTAWPTAIFDKYVYTFAKTGETTGVVKAPDNDGFFLLEIGTYTVTVQAYIGNAEPYTLAASGVSASFSVSSGSSNQVKVSLSSVAAGGKGEFSYNITYPENASAEITLQKWPGMNSITLNPVAISGGNGITQTLQLETGTYLLSIFISKNGLYAGISEAIHIYPPLATAYTKNFDDSDLLPPQTPTATDFYVANLSQSYNNIAAVTITPKSGKSSGSITVYYEGTGSTTYARSTATPTTAGTYIVTFDVTAVKLWNAASGLIAGTLTIYNYPTFNSIAAFNTWLSAQPANSTATPYVVALNVNSLGGDSDTSGSLGYVLNANSTKYVSLNLSGSTITSINASAFFASYDYETHTYKSTLVGITIPNSVTKIEEAAFKGCINLTSVTIPTSVTSIGDYAFSGCTSLTSVTIPYSVRSIGYAAFSFCTGLTSVTIPNGVTSIGDSAFNGCTSLVSVTIPNSVRSIGDSAFNGCNSLTAINVDSGNYYYSSEQGVLYNKNKSILIQCPGGKSGAFTIPNSVINIESSAFYNCTSLTSITIPASVTSIGRAAFYNCTSLTSINIPNSVINIGSSAFYNCASLISVTIPASVTSIGHWVFSYCTSLASVTIPASVTSIGYAAFFRCISLTSITIPNSVTSIENNAFSFCTGLTSVTIPNGVTSIGDSAFSDCNSLASVTIPTSVTSIGYAAFSHCISLTSVTIPNSVTSIGASAFSGCTSLTSITIPFVGATLNGTSNTHFGYIFGASSSSNHNSSIIPASLKTVIITGGNSISAYAFSGCSGLTNITIPASVTNIGTSAFSGCTSLTSITIPFVGATLNGTSNTHFGYIFGASSSSNQNSSIPASLKTVIITGGSIPASAFSGCINLTGVTIGSSVTSIEPSAFSGCTGLTAINIDASNTAYSSDNGVVYNKNKTTLVAYPVGKTGAFTIPSSVTSIGSSAFSGCTGLTSVTIPNSVTSIGSSAFSGCTGLTGVTIPSSVTSIGNSAFSGCTGLTSVTIPNSVTNIGSSAFSGCTGLTGVTIPSNVTSIGASAFSGCTGLTSVTIPNSVTSIGSSAFSGCTGLTSVTFERANTTVSTDSFPGDLRTKYLAGGIGTYTRTSGSNTWTAPSTVVWTAVTNTAFSNNDNIQCIAWGNNKFVAIAENRKGAYSADGINWTAITDTKLIATSAATYKIAYGNNKFVVVGGQNSAYSTDGITWTSVALFANGGIAWGNNKFVAVGNNNTMAYSADGINWTTVTNTTFGNYDVIYDIAWGNNKFVAVADGANGGKAAYSADGINWTAVTGTEVISFDYNSRIAWGNNKFVVTNKFATVFSSDDGITWKATELGDISGVGKVAWGNNKFVATSGSNGVAYSADGITWTYVENTTFADARINSFAWGSNKFVAVGSKGQMAYWDGN